MREVRPEDIQFVMQLLMQYTNESSGAVKEEYSKKFTEMTSTLDQYGISITANSEHIAEINKNIGIINKLLYAGVICTQDEYDKLTDEQKQNGKIYFIVDKHK